MLIEFRLNINAKPGSESNNPSLGTPKNKQRLSTSIAVTPQNATQGAG